MLYFRSQSLLVKNLCLQCRKCEACFQCSCSSATVFPVTAPNHRCEGFLLLNFLLCWDDSQNDFSFQLNAGLCLLPWDHKGIVTVPFLFAGRQNVFALEFIEIFWPSFIPLYPEQRIGKFFVSTFLNCNCYLTEAVHWKLLVWCQMYWLT